MQGDTYTATKHDASHTTLPRNPNPGSEPTYSRTRQTYNPAGRAPRARKTSCAAPTQPSGGGTTELVKERRPPKETQSTRQPTRPRAGPTTKRSTEPPRTRQPARQLLQTTHNNWGATDNTNPNLPTPHRRIIKTKPSTYPTGAARRAKNHTQTPLLLPAPTRTTHPHPCLSQQEQTPRTNGRRQQPQHFSSWRPTTQRPRGQEKSTSAASSHARRRLQPSGPQCAPAATHQPPRTAVRSTYRNDTQASRKRDNAAQHSRHASTHPRAEPRENITIASDALARDDNGRATALARAHTTSDTQSSDTNDPHPSTQRAS